MEPTLPLGVALDATSGCHNCVQAALVQIHLPCCSAERWYSVRPCESTRTDAPSDEIDAVLTTFAAPPPLVCDADGEELLLLELLPHAATKSETTTTAGRSFVM
jgi:hypothetical protein